MKKSKAMQAMPALLTKWEQSRDGSEKREVEDCFSDFFGWIEDNYPSYTQFRSTAGAKYDFELWFDENFNQTWKR